MLNPKNHYVVVAFPVQGHINPALQFAKRLVRLGAQVTFVTSVSAHRRIFNNNTINLLNSPTTTSSSNGSSITFTPFSDGYDDGFKSNDDARHFWSELKRLGSQALTDLILTSEDQARPVKCLIHTLLLPWAAEVARSFGVSSTLLWIQSAVVFDINYYYYNGCKDQILEVINNGDLSSFVELPGLPKLTCRDLPSFFLPSNPYSSTLTMFEEQFESLKMEISKPPRVFINTFDKLEIEAVKVLHGVVDLIAIGPLIPSAYLDGKDPFDTRFGGDMFQSSQNCLEWLNSKGEASVVYVSFGSLAVLRRRQVEEIARGLVEIERPFLWVLRRPPPESDASLNEDEEQIKSLIDEINKGEQGLIVSWCPQIEVLSHGSVGCFVSHCGWNSTLESLVVGVPVVAFPRWVDQWTNAKLIEDVWGTGVRVRATVKSKDGEEDLVESEEIKRCVEMVMGEEVRGEEIRRNVEKWKDLARKAVEDCGSSQRNLVAFLEEIGQEQ